MAAELGGMERWREFFRTANADIFEIIEKAIIVAASDCPKELMLRRDRIAEILFTARMSGRCMDCSKVELSVPESYGGSKESKANSSADDRIDVKANRVSNCSFGDAEALTDEIEEEGLMLDEVLRIKEVLQNFQDESDSVLYESLRRLQLMQLSVDILKVTEIGKTVNGIRRHSGKQIRHLVRELIDEWKANVDEWVQATQETRVPAVESEEGTPDSVHPSIDYEEGLPSPPMDDCAFFTTQNIDFSQFFDGMDDDGNPQNSGKLNKSRESGRRPPMVKPNVSKEKEQISLMKQESPSKPCNRPLNTVSGRAANPSGEQRTNTVHKLQPRSDKPNIPRTPVPQEEKIRCSNDDSIKVKLEAAKRKLHERYQEAEKAKKQRTIQVMELHDLPKQSLAQRNFNKSGNHNRNRANARR